MDQIWHRPNLVGPNMAPTKFGWTKNGPDQIWFWTKYGLDQIWARPNMLDQIWSDQKWPTKSVSTKSGLTPEFLGAHLYPHCVLVFRVFLWAPAPTLPPKKLKLEIEKSPNFRIIIIMSCDTDNFGNFFLKIHRKCLKRFENIDDFECL